MDRYRTKRRLLRPLTWWRRRRARRLGPINHAVWEAMAYSSAMRRFYFRARAEPDLLFDADLPSDAVVLDVGAFEGAWSDRLLQRVDATATPQISVHAFEPAPGAVRSLEERFAAEPRVVVHPFGLGASDARVLLTIEGPGSTVYGGTGPTTAVDLRDVAEVLGSLGIARIHLAKVNIEGGEYDLISRLHDTGWLARTETIIVQFHEFVPAAHRRRRASRRQLRTTHSCMWRYGWVYERWDLRPSVARPGASSLAEEGAR